MTDKKGIEFIFGDSKSLRERQEQSLYPGQSQGGGALPVNSVGLS